MPRTSGLASGNTGRREVAKGHVNLPPGGNHNPLGLLDGLTIADHLGPDGICVFPSGLQRRSGKRARAGSERARSVVDPEPCFRGQPNRDASRSGRRGLGSGNPRLGHGNSVIRIAGDRHGGHNGRSDRHRAIAPSPTAVATPVATVAAPAPVIGRNISNCHVAPAATMAAPATVAAPATTMAARASMTTPATMARASDAGTSMAAVAPGRCLGARRQHCSQYNAIHSRNPLC